MALTPSERITLIKEIGRRLATEDWPLIDVTLKQFSLPWMEEWRDTKDSYVLAMIDDATDDTLIDLALHVGFQLPTTALLVEPPFWRKGMFKLFITHLASQRQFAADLQEGLLDFGISGFVAHNDIEPAAEWQMQIETALASCDALVAILHPNFHKSEWTDQEIGFAMGRGVPVFSVRFGQDPYGFIGRFQAFNGNGKSALALAHELFEACRKNKQTQALMADILVGLLEQSGSYAYAKIHVGYLEDLEVWKPSFSKRLQKAVQNNLQVAEAWDVPERIAALVKKWAKSGI
jgi:hypothetical protein